MRAAVLVCTLSWIASGCGASPPEREHDATSAMAPPVTAFERALQVARRRRAELEADRPPPYAAPSKTAAFEYVANDLGARLNHARRLNDAATDAYADAAQRAPDAGAEIAVLVEAADMTEAFVRAYKDAVVNVLQPYVDAEEQKAATKAFEEVSWPLRAKALRRCVERADARGLRTAGVDRCRSALASHAPQDERKSSEPAWVETTHPAPCVFAGSLVAGSGALLYGDPVADGPVGSLNAGEIVRVTRLELPDKASGRYKITLDQPVRTTAWLDAHARVLALPRRVDLVPGHIWVDADVPAEAHRVGQEQAAFSLASLADDVQLEAPSHLPPVAAACADIRLARAPDMVAGSRPNGTWHDFPADTWTPVFAGTEGQKPIARVRKLTARAVSQEGTWMHVATSRWPVSLDAWARASQLTESGWGVIGVIESPRTPYRAVRGGEAAVRLRPDAGAPVVGVLSPEAEVRVEKEEGGFCAVTLRGLSNPTDAAKHFFIERSALEPVSP